jgi:cytidyltransferase-like protein
MKENRNKRRSMFIGRFQPFHDGHMWLIEQRLKLGKDILIGVMDIHDCEPEKNPFETQEVVQIIQDRLKDLINEGKVEIMVVPPIESINYGRTVGYDIIEHEPPEEIKQISATKIRQKILK